MVIESTKYNYRIGPAAGNYQLGWYGPSPGFKNEIYYWGTLDRDQFLTWIKADLKQGNQHKFY